MIEWAILATVSSLASSILETAKDGFLSNQSDRAVLQIVGKISDKLKTQTPADNHELAKAFRRACVVATQHICDSRKTTISGQSSFAPQHNLASPLLGSTTTSLFAEDEQQWLEKANQYLKKQIEDLNQDRVFLPERKDKAYQSLINPQEENQQVWANQFKQQMTADVIAELHEIVGEPSQSIIGELENRWFLQACNEFQMALSHNQILSNKFQNNMLVKLDSGQELTLEILLQMFQFLRESVNLQPKDLPKLVGRLTERVLFVDRVDEQKNLIEWLTQKSKKVVVVKAASGYGKTSLVMEVLHTLTPDQKLLDERLDALLIFLCRDGEGDFREVCKKVDVRLGRKEDSFVSRYDEFATETQQSPDKLPNDIIKDIVEELAKLGNVWLVFDNFEIVLGPNRINEPHLRVFFEKALQTNGLHFLLTSQKVPQFESRADIEKLEIEGLPDVFALEFLQTEGEKLKKDNRIDCGLAESTNEDLQKLKELGFACVPMALVALVGYLEASYQKYGETMAKVVEDRQLFAKFREHDAKAGSMYLIEKQYLALTAEEHLVLKALSIFPQAIEFPVLEKVLAEHSDEKTIYRVVTSNTLVRRIGANLYELLPQAKEVVSKQPDETDEIITQKELHVNATNFYDSIHKPKNEWKNETDAKSYIEEIYHLIQSENFSQALNVIQTVEEQLGFWGYAGEVLKLLEMLDPQTLSDLRRKFFRLGNVYFYDGNFREAIKSYNEALTINEKLKDESWEATIKINEANAYYNLGDYWKTIELSNRALEIFRKFYDTQNEGIALTNLANGYSGLGKKHEAIEYYKKALVKHKQANDRISEGIGLTDLGIAYYDLSKYQKASDYCREAVAINKDEKNKVWEGKALGYLGMALYELGQQPKGIELVKEALKITEEVHDNHFEGICSRWLANLKRR